MSPFFLVWFSTTKCQGKPNVKGKTRKKTNETKMFTFFCHTYHVCKCVKCECSKQNSSKMLRIENSSHNPVQSSAFKLFEVHTFSLNCPKIISKISWNADYQGSSKVVRSTSRPSKLFKTWARTLSSYKLRPAAWIHHLDERLDLGWLPARSLERYKLENRGEIRVNLHRFFLIRP